MNPTVKIAWEEGADEEIGVPAYETAGAAGADLRAQLPEGPLSLAPGERKLVSTGLKFEIPSGFEVQVRPRSGFALKQGVTLLNAPGTIDSDYRGVVGVILINLGQDHVTISHGDRIAQMVVAPVAQARFNVVTELDDTPRGSGGFGSTGSA